jgi:hypothetical protein
MAFLSHMDVKKHLSGESGKIIIDCEKQTISFHGFKDHDYLMAVLDEQETLDDIYHFAWLRNFIANGGTYYGPTSKLIA